MSTSALEIRNQEIEAQIEHDQRRHKEELRLLRKQKQEAEEQLRKVLAKDHATTLEWTDTNAALQTQIEEHE